MNFLSELKFIFKKPKVVIVTGQARNEGKNAISRVLEQYFKIGREILIKEGDLADPADFQKFCFWLKNSALPILVVLGLNDGFSNMEKLAKEMPSRGCLVLNFDDEALKNIKGRNGLKELTFGFQSGADLQATDIKYNSDTNFKINYKGSIVPVWLAEPSGEKQIYSALAAAAVGIIFDLNLVEISQALKNYQAAVGNG